MAVPTGAVLVVVTLLTDDFRRLGRLVLPCRYDEVAGTLYALHSHSQVIIERDGALARIDLFLPADDRGCLVPAELDVNGQAVLVRQGDPYLLTWGDREVLKLTLPAAQATGNMRIAVPTGAVTADGRRLGGH